MTNIDINRNNYGRFQTVFASCVLAALVIAIFAGTRIPVSESCMIIPKSPFNGEPVWKTTVRLCFADTVMFWILSLPLSGGLTVASSAAVFFFRGLVLGCAMRIFVTNSVTYVSVALLLSYAGLTLFALIYDAFLNGMGERSGLCRLISCLVATGCAAVIKLLPMLLLI